MTKLYLITGFLGSGKTTFLHELAGLFPGKSIAVIVNEFGKMGVDGALLRNLDVELTEINNGSIFCACKIEQFEEAVRRVLETRKSDIIFVEASGLSDPTAVRAVFAKERFPDLEYAGAICLADAARFHKTYETAKVCRMQLAASDLVIVNKTDVAPRERIDAIIATAKAQKPERAVYETAFGRLKPEWLDALRRYSVESDGAGIHTRDITLQKLSLRISGFREKSLMAFLRMIADDTYRIKGFARLPEGVFMADCAGPLVELRPYYGDKAEINCLTVLYGNGLPAKKSVKEAIARFPECGIIVEQ